MVWREVLRHLVFLPLLAMPAVAYADLRADMVKFDQSHIPALVLSAQSRALTAPAMDALMLRWAWFKQRQAYRSDRDTQWNFDLTAIEHALLNAQRLVGEGSYADAHASLEVVHTTFIQMRRRIGLAYFPDALWRFHQPMERLLHRVGGEHGPAEEDALRLAYAGAAAAWEEVLDWPLNPYDYGLDSVAGNALRKSLLAEQQVLKRFGQALAAGDRAAQLSAASEIRDCFIIIYSDFGHFPERPKTTTIR